MKRIKTQVELAKSTLQGSSEDSSPKPSLTDKGSRTPQSPANVPLVNYFIFMRTQFDKLPSDESCPGTVGRNEKSYWPSARRRSSSYETTKRNS